MRAPEDLHHRYRGVRTAVLGASGFIGRWVARLLCSKGAWVFLIVRNRAAFEKIYDDYDLAGQVIEQDLSDAEGVFNLLHSCRPSITFNLVGYGIDRAEQDQKTSYEINADLVLALSEALAGITDPKWLGQAIVHVGSALEYGSIDGSLDEDSIPNPTTIYGKSKLAGTAYLRQCSRAYGIRGVTARLFTVYGPGEHAGRLLPSMLHAARTREPLPLTAGEQKRDFCYVEDIAEGLLRLGVARVPAGSIVNLATGRLTSVGSFAETAAEILQFPSDGLRFGALPTRADEMCHSEVTVARLRRFTGWVPGIGIAEGIRRTLNFESGYEPAISMAK